MAYRLTVSDRAVREIGEACEWYEEQLHGLGAEFIDALDAQLQLITQTPLLFPEIRRGIRRTLLSHFPYGVFYASKGDVSVTMLCRPLIRFLANDHHHLRHFSPLNCKGLEMSSELVNGLTVLIDSDMVAVEDTFEKAVSAATRQVASALPTAKIQICTASSQVFVGRGASPPRTWNYDRTSKEWVEFLR